MKLSDFLKKLGINLDEELGEMEKPNANTNSSQENNTRENIKEKLNIKYDTNTGLFDLNSVDNEQLKEVLKLANNTVKNNSNKLIIDKAISKKLGTVKLNKGITNDLILKALDMSNIKVVDGQAKGIDEAFEALSKSQSGLFKSDKEDSNPMMEGFSPVNNNIQDYSNLSLTQAYKIENA